MTELNSRSQENVAADMLYGLKAIALEILGDDGPDAVRKIRYRTSTTDIPVFRMNGTVCARRSSLWEWVAKLEAAAREKR
ncbi:hypothetical protein [Caenispirillum bisanense]|uniref:hypothetical protein n=1 Tax=Caenispirillum bisanense TaxID=414052 RepID=UPI0031D7EF38